MNGTHPATLNMGGGSFNLPQATTVPVTLLAGNNTITFGNPGTYAPDLDRIVISGDGSAVAPNFMTYEAEAAQLSGTASVGGCSLCSGGAYVGNYGAGNQNAVTFPAVTVAKARTYQLEIDYTTSGQRTFYIYVNNGPPTILNENGSTFDSPVPAVNSCTTECRSKQDRDHQSQSRGLCPWSGQHHRWTVNVAELRSVVNLELSNMLKLQCCLIDSRCSYT